MQQKANITDPKSEYDRLVKFLVIGDSPSGKTTLAHAMIGEPIADYYNPTIAIDFKIRIINYGNKKIKLQIWDTSGVAAFRVITTAYYRGAQILFYTIDLANHEHLNNVHDRMKEIRTHTSEKALIILVGILPKIRKLRIIEHDDIQEVADQYSLTYVELNNYNHEDVRQMVMTSLSKMFFLNNDNQDFIVYDNKTLTLDQEIETLLPICMKNHKTLTENITLIANINTLISRTQHISKNTSDFYSAKLFLMKNIFSHQSIFDDLAMLPNLFMQYMDALGGTFHQLDGVSDSMKSEHLSLLIRFFDRMNNNPHYQMAIITELCNFYKDSQIRYFPCDNMLQPIIICKLTGWMHNQPALHKLKALTHLPYLGSMQLIINELIGEITLIISSHIKNIQTDCEKIIDEISEFIRKYHAIQKRLLAQRPSELNELHLAELRILQYCALISSNIKYLETSFTSATSEIQHQFITDLQLPVQHDETSNEYNHRIAVARFLIETFTFERNSYVVNFQQNDDITNKLIMKSFEILRENFTRFDELSILYTQHAVDLLTRFKQLEEHNLTITQCQMKSLNVAATYLLKYTYSIPTINDIEMQQICIILIDFVTSHWEMSKVVAQFQHLQKITNNFAKSLCEHILGNLMMAITPNESYEAYLERLSALVAIFALHGPMRQHFYARMILLVNAEEIIHQAPTDEKLVEKDFRVAYNNLAYSPENEMAKFVATRPEYYLQALCRCYRQNVSLGVSAITLVKQYLIVLYKQIAISTDTRNLIINIVNEQIITQDLISLINDLSIEELTILARNNITCLSNFIRSDTIDFLIHKIRRPTTEALLKLANAIVLANKCDDILQDIQRQAFKIYNPNIFHIITVFFQSLALKDKDISLMIDVIEVVLNTLINVPKDFCEALNVTPYDLPVSQLLQCVPNDHELYTAKFLPLISCVSYKLLTNTMPYVFTHVKDASHKQQSIALSLCLLKHDANILYGQTIETQEGNQQTNTMLFLLESKHFDILKEVLEFYRTMPHKIIDINPNNNYLGKNPLFIAISNNANHPLITLMLELGFSSDLVNTYLSAEHDDLINKKSVDKIKDNASALTALYLFALKAAKPKPPQKNEPTPSLSTDTTTSFGI